MAAIFTMVLKYWWCIHSDLGICSYRRHGEAGETLPQYLSWTFHDTFPVHFEWHSGSRSPDPTKSGEMTGGGYSRSASDASAGHMALPSLYHDGEEFEADSADYMPGCSAKTPFVVDSGSFFYFRLPSPLTRPFAAVRSSCAVTRRLSPSVIGPSDNLVIQYLPLCMHKRIMRVAYR